MINPKNRSWMDAFLSMDPFYFLFCVAGIYGSYMTLGWAQEYLSMSEFGSEKEKWKFTFFLIFCQCVGQGFMAATLMYVKEGTIKDKSNSKISDFLIISVSYVFAMVCTTQSIQYVSFPTMVLAKCCKPIPVLLISVFVFGRWPAGYKFVVVFLISAGISLFTLTGSVNDKGSGSSSSWGLTLLAISLLLDGVTGPLQERIIRRTKVSDLSLQLWLNVCAAGLLLVVLFVSADTELYPAVGFVLRHPPVLALIAIYSCIASIGQLFIMRTISKYGSLITTITTTTRKFFTMLISVFLFGHSLNAWQWFGVLVVFFALIVDIVLGVLSKKRTIDFDSKPSAVLGHPKKEKDR